MIKTAEEIVRRYALDLQGIISTIPQFDVYLLVKCQMGNNWYFLFSTWLFDGNYYEVTYNGSAEEWYISVFTKRASKSFKG